LIVKGSVVIDIKKILRESLDIRETSAQITFYSATVYGKEESHATKY